MKTSFSIYILFMVFSVVAQNNNATKPGNWDNCNTWNSPFKIYNSAQNPKTILPGVTVIQNQANVFSGKITLSGNSKIILPDSNHKISFVGSGVNWDCGSTYLDNIVVDFNDHYHANSVSGFLKGLNTHNDIEAKDPTGLWTYPVNDTTNKIVPLKPKLFRQGKTSKYQVSYDLAKRVHMILSDSWERRCYQAIHRDFPEIPEEDCLDCYGKKFNQITLLEECDFNVGETYKFIPVSSPEDIIYYKKLLNKWFDWGLSLSSNHQEAIVWECWNEPDYCASWDSDRFESLNPSPLHSDYWNRSTANGNNFNEPLNFYWPTNIRKDFFNTYTIFYKTLEARIGRYPSSKAAGPSLAFFNETDMRAFFDHCLKEGLEVNVVTWHELTDNFNSNAINDIKKHVDFVRNEFMNNTKYKSLKIESIEINEIIGKNDKCNPAVASRYFQALEDAKVDYACKTGWQSNLPSDTWNNTVSPNGYDRISSETNTFDNLFNRNCEKNSNWWAYKFYADGVERRVKSYNEQPRSFVIANKVIVYPPTESNYAQVLFGYTDSENSLTANGTYRIRLNNITAIMPGANQGTHFQIRIKKLENPIDQTVPAPNEYENIPEIDYGDVYRYPNTYTPTGTGPYTIDSDGSITLIIKNIERENLYQLAIFKEP